MTREVEVFFLREEEYGNSGLRKQERPPQNDTTAPESSRVVLGELAKN